MVKHSICTNRQSVYLFQPKGFLHDLRQHHDLLSTSSDILSLPSRGYGARTCNSLQHADWRFWPNVNEGKGGGKHTVCIVVRFLVQPLKMQTRKKCQVKILVQLRPTMSKSRANSKDSHGLKRRDSDVLVQNSVHAKTLRGKRKVGLRPTVSRKRRDSYALKRWIPEDSAQHFVDTKPNKCQM